MEQRGNAVAWLALIIGILALILAWSAYNRAGVDLEEQVDDVVDETASDLEDQAETAADALNEITVGTSSTTTAPTE